MRVSFYLKQPKDKEGMVDIYLQGTYSHKKITFYFNQRIRPEHWNKCAQRVHDWVDGYLEINKLLDDIEKYCIQIYTALRCIKTPIPSTEVIKNRLRIIFSERGGSIKVYKLNYSNGYQRSMVNELPESYLQRLALKQGFTKDIITGNKSVLELKKNIIILQRLTKQQKDATTKTNI